MYILCSYFEAKLYVHAYFIVVIIIDIFFFLGRQFILSATSRLFSIVYVLLFLISKIHKKGTHIHIIKKTFITNNEILLFTRFNNLKNQKSMGEQTIGIKQNVKENSKTMNMQNHKLV